MRICDVFGGYLATVSDNEEQAFLQTLVAKSEKVSWLGGSDAQEEGNWKWITGEPFTFINWKSGEPNNNGNSENYLGMYLSNNSYKWNDFSDSNSTVGGFICEWDSAEDFNCITPIISDTDSNCVNSLLSIGNNAFDGCTSLMDVYYPSTDEVWTAVSIGTNNEPLTNATFHFQHVHTYGEPIVQTPTCTERGFTSIRCSDCGYSHKKDYVAAYGHAFDEWTMTKDPTCAQEGEEQRACTRCGETQTRVVAKLNHVYETAVTEPTCTERGYTTLICSRCGYSYQTDYVAALGHAYGEWATTTEPTCTEEGEEQRTCSRCGETQTRVVAKLNHVYETAVTEPTCTERGYTTFTCSRCGYSYQTDYVAALGHAYGEWVTTTEPTCTEEGEEQQTCSRCGKIQSRAISALGHEYETFVTDPSCTERGFTTYVCNRCDSSYQDDYVSALGHDYGDWQIDAEPTCTQAGSRYRVCSRCTDRQEETTPIIDHIYGEWEITKEATFLETGSMRRSCAMCGLEETQVIECLELDINTNQDYGIAYLTVVHAQTLDPIAGAGIYVSTENDGEGTFFTDEEGKVSIPLPVGKQMLSVYSNGYLTRYITVNITAGVNEIPRIGLSDRGTYDAELTSREMTLEEIEAAGIDTSAPGNNHVYEYELKLEYEAEIDFLSILAYFNFNGEYIGGSYGSGGIGGGVGSGISIEPTIYPAGQGIRVPGKDSEEEITVYPVSENFYLIVRGRAKWLKEMFDVEMLVINNSETDTLEDLTAELILPEGLSLTKMYDEQQSLIYALDNIAEGESEAVHWYVRGDQEGSYSLEARLQGTIMPFEEPIDDYFKSENQLQVLAGSALHLDFSFPNAAYYAEDYPITITLTNVSDKTIYNISHYVQIEQGMEIYYSDGSSKEKIEKSTWEGTGVREFYPNDQIIIETTTNIFFESEIMERQIQSWIGIVNGVEHLLNSLKAVKKVTDLTTSFVNCVVNCVNALDSFDFTLVTEDEEKLKLMRSLYSNISGLMLSHSKFEDKTLDAAIRLADAGFRDSLKALTEDPEDWIKKHSVKDIRELLSKTKALGLALTASEEVPQAFNIFDSLRTAISAIPIRFALRNVVMNESERNTTSIPWSYTTYPANPQYFGISNVGKYIWSLGIAACGEAYDDYMPWYFKLLPGMDDPFNKEEAISYIHATEKEIARVKAKDATGKVTFTVRVERAHDTTPSLYEVEETPFTLSCNNPTAVIENNILTFTGDGTISITPNSLEDGVLYIEDSTGNQYTYQIDVVPQHDCTSDTWISLVQPEDDEVGYHVKCCDICGDIIAVEEARLCEEHSYGSSVQVVPDGCVEGGVYEKVCTVCGHAEYEYTEPLNHTWDEGIITTEPTINSPGEILYTCTRCGQTQTETLPMLPHEHAYIAVITAPTCTEKGFTTYTCTGCGDSYTADETPALSHDYVTTTVPPTQNDEGFDEHVCSHCGDTYRDNFVEALGIGYDASLKIKTASISLQNNIAINFYVADSVLAGWDAPYIIFQKARYDTNGQLLGYETETVSEFKLVTLNGVACHMFKYSGITAAEMGSEVTATLYANKDERDYGGNSVTYSVLRYANNTLNRTQDPKLRTLLVDLLNFGAAAQTYWSYNTANLVNAGLTEEQRSFATQTDPDAVSCKALIKNAGATVSFKTCSLTLEDSVAVNYYLNLTNYKGKKKDLQVRVTYTDELGNLRTDYIDAADFEYKKHTDGKYYYVAKLTTLNATQMRTVLTAEVYSKSKGIRISDTVKYSIESYVSAMQGASDAKLKALVNCMLKYGDSAARYFA